MKKEYLMWCIEIKTIYYSDEQVAFNVYLNKHCAFKIGKGVLEDCTQVMQFIGNYIGDKGFETDSTIIVDDEMISVYS